MGMVEGLRTTLWGVEVVDAEEEEEEAEAGTAAEEEDFIRRRGRVAVEWEVRWGGAHG